MKSSLISMYDFLFDPLIISIEILTCTVKYKCAYCTRSIDIWWSCYRRNLDVVRGRAVYVCPCEMPLVLSIFWIQRWQKKEGRQIRMYLFTTLLHNENSLLIVLCLQKLLFFHNHKMWFNCPLGNLQFLTMWCLVLSQQPKQLIQESSPWPSGYQKM